MGLHRNRMRHGPADSADQRSDFGSKDAAGRFDITAAKGRGNSISAGRDRTSNFNKLRRAIFPPRGLTVPQTLARHNLPDNPIAPGNGWSPLPPWDPAFPGAFLRALRN